MSVGRVGGLYVAVGADIKDALSELNKLKAAVSDVSAEMSKIGKASGGSKASGDLDRTATSARKASEEVQKYAQANGVALNAEQKKSLSTEKARQALIRKLQALQKSGAALTKEQQALLKSAQAADKAAASTRKLADSKSRMSKTMPQLNQGLYRFSQAFVNLRYGNPLGIIVGLTQGLSSMGTSLRNNATNLGNFGGKLGKIGSIAGLAVSGLAAAAVAVVAFGAGLAAVAAAIGKFGVQAASSLQMTKIQYEGLLGSANRANAEVAFLLDLAQNSVVPTENLLEANRLLLAYGITADGTRRQLVQFFSDFAAATGLPASRLNDLAYALGQIESQGKANTIDMRQLANAGINLAAVYEKIAEQQGVTVEEARGFTEAGKLTGAVLIPALLGIGEAYKKTGEKARQSFQGISANLKDIIQVNLAQSFTPFLEKLTGGLQKLEEFISRLEPMFVGIGEAFENLFFYISNAFSGLDDNYATTTDFWNYTFPQALNVTFSAIGILIRYVRTLWETFVILGNVAYAAIAGIGGGIMSVLQVIASGIDQVLGWIPWIGDAMEGAVQWFDDMAASAATSVKTAEQQVATSAAIIAQIWSTPVYKDLVYRVRMENDYPDAGARRGPAAPTLPVTPPPTPSFGGSGGRGSGGSGRSTVDPAIQQWKDWLARLKEIIAAALAGLKTIQDAVRKPFGELSNIQKTFRGGSIDGLIGLYDRLSDAVTKFYGPATAKWLVGTKAARRASKQMKGDLASLRKSTAQTIKLIRENEKLEKRRKTAFASSKKSLEESYAKQLEDAAKTLDAATDTYESANDKLSEMIEERDDFIENIRTSARSFVNALSLEEETFDQFTRLDGSGSFVSEQKKRTQSFRESLQSRLKTLRDWTSKVKALKSRGLDDRLLQDLIGAGPEESAEVVNQLANSSDDILREVNDLQGQLRSEIDQFSDFSSAAWFDAGIADQQVITDNAKSAVDAAREVFQGLEKERDEALEALEKSYEDYTDALGKQIKENERTAKKIGEKVQKEFKKLSKSSYAAGLEVANGLIEGMTDKDSEIVAAAKRLADQIANQIRKSLNINSPSKLTMYLGEMVGQGLAAGMDDTTGKIEASARRLSRAAVPDITGATAPEIRVYIGDRELTDIVDVQIGANNTAANNYVRAGRRV